MNPKPSQAALCAALSALLALLLTASGPSTEARAARQAPAAQQRVPANQASPRAVVSRGPEWVWSPEPSPNDRIYLRQPLRLTDAPAIARITVEARGPWTLFVNGIEVTRGATGRVTPVSITRTLGKGRNVLAFECEGGRTTAGLKFELAIRYPNDRTATVVSSGDERVSRQPSPNWQAIEFDDSKWILARVVGSTTAAVPTQQRPPAAPPVTLPAANGDPSRLVRMWDIRAGGRTNEDPYSRQRDAGDRMVLSAGVPLAADVPLLASAGFTLLESASDSLSTDEVSRGVWDFTAADADHRLARSAGFDWSYFPHFAFPPKWLRDQSAFTRIQCVEHGQPVQAFSPWDPAYAGYVARGYQKLAQQLGGRGGLAGIDLGIHGEFGEAGLLVGARTADARLRDDWQKRFGNVHDHAGFWCGDPLARAAFRGAMIAKYRDLDRLNQAWKTRFRTTDEITYPANANDVSRRYWLDFVHWYQSGVTDMAAMISGTARKSFPDTLLTLPIGFSDENPRGGNDNTRLVKMAAKERVDVRSTHGGYRPFAENQATMLGRIASACAFYDVPLWIEPSGRVTPEQQVGRIFAAASLGAKGYFDWPDNVRDGRDVYYRYGKYLKVERPVVDVAMLFPTTSHLLRPDTGYPQVFAKGCADIRDVLNYDIVDEPMVADGALDHYRVLVMWEGAVYEPETLARLQDWVQAGGVLAAYDFGKVETVEGDRSWFTDLFGYAGKLKPATAALRFTSPDPLPARYRVNPGVASGAPFLVGDWLDSDTSGGVSRRWTGAKAEVRLPLDIRRHRELLIRASFPAETAGKKREVFVNGEKVGEIDTAQETTYSFPLPASVAGKTDVAVVTIQSDPFIPSDIIRGSKDRRATGTLITWVQVDPESAPPPVADPGTPSGSFESSVDISRLRTEWAKPYGKGWTVYFPARRAQLPSYYEVVRYLTYHLSDLDNTKRDAVAVDDAWDGVYATLFTDKILYYNPKAETVTRSIVLSPAAFTARRDVRTPASFKHDLTMETNTITPIYFEAPPQELLFQCEGFRGLGTLQPLQGGAFSPGQGATHVLIPVGGQISTRIQCDVPGRYRVYYRTVRKGALAPAEVTVDGAAPRSGRSAAGPSGAQTLLAGTVELSSGVHTLAVRPRAGEDLRADFVILATDPTISGYSFAVRPAAGSSPAGR